ncbi:hypothetical protein ACPPVO_16005 [Dactylosporangium sp. McL0621]|uniref:hypothetical protein n=1 Tax=Dactylosporangium sp. McL0621 TaxID=3415678 RepID=UPI003CF2EEC5
MLSALAVAGGQVTAAGNRRIEEIRRAHPNAYQPWTGEDDRRLVPLHAEHIPIKELSAIFGRQVGAIASRLRHLGQVVPEPD